MRWLFILPVVLLLCGCVTSTTQTQQELADNASFKSREELLLSTNNTGKLIEFYKESLRKQESSDIRIKLVSAYVDAKDYDSAAFHVEQIIPDSAQQTKVLFLRAKIDFSKGKVESAYRHAVKALQLEPRMAEAENLLGLIWAGKGDYQKSRYYFLQARKHFYDDITIKNNLAVLDLIEGNYQEAVGRLYSIYEKGNEDAEVLSNLVLGYAKLGMYKPLEEVLKTKGYTTNQAQQIYIALRKTNSEINRQEAALLSDTKPAKGEIRHSEARAIGAIVLEEVE